MQLVSSCASIHLSHTSAQHHCRKQPPPRTGAAARWLEIDCFGRSFAWNRNLLAGDSSACIIARAHTHTPVSDSHCAQKIVGTRMSEQLNIYRFNRIAHLCVHRARRGRDFPAEPHKSARTRSRQWLGCTSSRRSSVKKPAVISEPRRCAAAR